MQNMTRWFVCLCLSWTLAIQGCSLFGMRVYSNDPPPCHREDVESAFAANGTKRADGLFLTYQCFDRLRGDANACLKTSSQ